MKNVIVYSVLMQESNNFTRVNYGTKNKIRRPKDFKKLQKNIENGTQYNNMIDIKRLKVKYNRQQ